MLLEGLGGQAPETAESQHSAPGAGSDRPHLVSVLYWRSVELIPFCSFVASATCNKTSLQLSSEVTKVEGKAQSTTAAQVGAFVLPARELGLRCKTLND